MQRYLLTAALLVLAATAQGMTPARQDANGSSGSCPEAQAAAAAAESGAMPQPGPRPAPAVAPATAKAEALVRPRSGARWHSFVPGMFK